jgi:hypothetical protein
MLQATTAAMLVMVPDKARPFESRWTSGLGVTTERLTGQTAVNGVTFRIHRATGRDVTLLAQRILDDWQRESGIDRVLSSGAGDWKSFSRIHHGRSEVVQWRGRGGGGELLWSSADLLHVDPLPQNGVPLPAQCRWSPTVHGIVAGSGFIQSSGSCPGEVPAVAARFRRLLSSSGWVVREADGSVLQTEHGRQKAQIMLIPGSAPGSSSSTDVVVLELRVSAP